MSRSNRKAFTVLEMLVAVVIFSLMMILLSKVFSHVSKSWTLGQGDLQTRRNIRALADSISDEMSKAVLPVAARAGGDAANLQFIVNPPSARVGAEYRNADAVFWQAPLATETSFGELAIVGYFVQWEENVPYLCRLFINPSITGADGAVMKNPDYKIYQMGYPDAWLTNDLLRKLVRPTDKASGYRGLFAANVVGLWVRCYGGDGQELSESFDSRVGYQCLVRTSLGSEVSEVRRLPSIVEISLASVDEFHVAQLANAATRVKNLVSEVRSARDFMNGLEAAAASEKALAALLPGTRIYTKRIVLDCAR